MSKVIKEISCITGTYTNAQGQQKNRYQRIGSIIDTRNGEMLKIDVIPLKEGGWDGWAYINDPKPKDDQQPRHAAPARSMNDLDDDIPDFN
jgi:hypothetical protein